MNRKIFAGASALHSFGNHGKTKFSVIAQSIGIQCEHWPLKQPAMTHTSQGQPESKLAG
jgi:hypothetical protein